MLSLAIPGNQTPVCWLSSAKPHDYTMPSSRTNKHQYSTGKDIEMSLSKDVGKI
jgi:hypothetical protein